MCAGRRCDAAFAENGMDGSNKGRGLFCGSALFVRAGVVGRQENQTEYSEEKMNACVAAIRRSRIGTCCPRVLCTKVA